MRGNPLGLLAFCRFIRFSRQQVIKDRLLNVCLLNTRCCVINSGLQSLGLTLRLREFMLYWILSYKSEFSLFVRICYRLAVRYMPQ